MKAFENHQRKEGETVSHGTAKELIAGFAVTPSRHKTISDWYQGVAVDRFVEDKGLNWIDQYIAFD